MTMLWQYRDIGTLSAARYDFTTCF